MKTPFPLIAVVLSFNTFSYGARGIGAPNDKVTITSVSYGGTGCRANTVSHVLSPDRQVLSLLFSDYIANAGVGSISGKPLDRKFCKIDLGLNIKPGWSFALFSVDVRGFAQLDKDAESVQKNSYTFPGTGISDDFGEYQLHGLFADDYFYHSEIPIGSLNWTDCSTPPKTLSIMTTLQAEANSGQALMTVDSIDGKVKHLYGMTWKACNSGDSSADSPGEL